MTRFATILFAVATLFGGIGAASAQHGGGGGGGGHGGGGGGGWHGGGGGGGWHGGGGYHGGGYGYGHGGYYHGGHYYVGIYGWGWGWGWPGYYYPYYYPSYYPSYPYYGGYPDDSGSAYIQQDTPAYGQGSFSSGPQAPVYWYCPDPSGYYPQVQTCARGWLRVIPAPSGSGPSAPAQQ